MSYQDDLDWLARNVHVWPTSTPHIVPAGDSVFEFGITFCENHACVYHREYTDSKVIYKKQWLARRAELQNKPSWGSVGSDINFISQHDDGQWIGHSEKPSEADECFECNCVVSLFGYGEVLGDWRDTLEKRPDVHKNHEEIDTSAERVQKTPESVCNWHEHGELPPVGVFVDVTGNVAYGEGEKCCEVIAHVEDCAVIRMSWGLGCFVSRALSPHRTERDELVDIIVSNGFLGIDGEACYLIADAIISAGFERNGGKS